MFIDTAELELCGGDGGDGAVSFRRERYVPRGGPDGGDGGRGGSVFGACREGLRTLNHLAGVRLVAAGRGGDGGPRRRAGKAGDDREILVPPGTEIRDSADNVLGELVKPGGRLLLARGGRGGRGNVHFATPTLQAPRYAEKGTPGERRHVRFVLKIIADVALLGPPNAGKSSLLTVLSTAHPKVAPYPFTTLAPQLGIVEVDAARAFAAVEVPGLVEGAAEGRGLGQDFLRHVERARALVVVVDVAATSPARDFRAVMTELSRFEIALTTRVRLVVANKIDLPYKKTALRALERVASRASAKEGGIEVRKASALSGEGVGALKQLLAAIAEPDDNPRS